MKLYDDSLKKAAISLRDSSLYNLATE